LNVLQRRLFDLQVTNQENVSQTSQLVKLKIADIVIEAKCSEPGTGLIVVGTMQYFMVEEGQPDCILDVYYGPLPDIKLEQQIYNSQGGPCHLFSSGGKVVLQIVGMHEGQEFIPRMAVFEPDFSRGDLFVRPIDEIPSSFVSPDAYKMMLAPFDYPLDVILVSNLLALKGGIKLHASGVIYGEGGLVFCGLADAGKSTMAGLWKERQVPVLSDERIALRKLDDRIYAYGTPWQSTLKTFCAEKTPLKAIYFIKHGSENIIVPLNQMEVVTHLMTRCFPPTYLREGMSLTLDFMNELAQEIPCFEFQFKPDQSAIDEVLNHVKDLRP
jgi:hypothetical protein